MKHSTMGQQHKEVVIFTSPSFWNYVLVNTIRKDFHVAGIVYEETPLRKKLSLLLKRRKRVGAFRLVGQTVFLFFDMLYLRRASLGKVRELFAHEDVSVPSAPSLKVSDINGSNVQDFLKQRQPAVVVVCGTGILRSSVLSLANCFINIHTGITPQYRGVHGGFWAMYNRDITNVGVTVHAVDKGVDTGGILYQECISVQPEWDTFWTIPAKQHLKGIELLMRALRDVERGKSKVLPRPHIESKQWYHPTIWQYIIWKRIVWTLRRENAR